MSFKAGRIDELRFEVGSLTASADGLFSVFSQESINGAIQSIAVGSNTYTNTGSLLFFFSGANNTGTLLGDLILRLRAGSMAQTVYPYVYLTDNQGVTGSNTTAAYWTQFVGNAPIRVVGSGLGAGTSGLYVTIKYR